MGLIKNLVIPILGLGISWLVYKLNKYRLYVEFITKERIRWMTELKNNVSKFLEISYYLKNFFENRVSNENDLNKMSELQYYISRIILDLNPNEKNHNEIIKILKEIRKILKEAENETESLAILFDLKDNKIEKLEKKFQIVFKEEWERIKKESKQNILKCKIKYIFNII